MPDGAEAFRERMIGGGWTELYLAQIFEVHPDTIGRWQSGESRVPPHVHMALDEAEIRGFPRGPDKTEGFSGSLVERMRAGGWSIQYLARALGASPGMIQHWRKSKATPPRHILLAIDAAERRGEIRHGGPPQARGR